MIMVTKQIFLLNCVNKSIFFTKFDLFNQKHYA